MYPFEVSDLSVLDFVPYDCADCGSIGMILFPASDESEHEIPFSPGSDLKLMKPIKS
jgi:hypothetical protein